MVSHISTPKEWAEPIATYTTWLRAAHRPETTIYLRSYQLRRFAVTMKTPPFDVTGQTLIEYLSMHDWSAETRRSVRSGLRSFYSWAHAAGRISEDPAAGLPTITTQIGKPRPAPEDAIKHGLDTADPRVRLMIDLAAYVGLRCCEICRVHSDDVGQDLLGWTLRVVGKGRKIRVVPITSVLAHRIRAAYGWVFPGQIDGHLSSAYVSKRISWVLPEGWTAHTLRHRFASAAYAGERDIRAVQELLGHSSVATTQRYTAIPNGASRRAMMAAAS